eukprot:7379939-Prymnesium_polylepis.1
MSMIRLSEGTKLSNSAHPHPTYAETQHTPAQWCERRREPPHAANVRACVSLNSDLARVRIADDHATALPAVHDETSH